MRLVGYQPQYFPRLHYYNRVLNSDIFEISDYVQFVRKHAAVQSDGVSKRVISYQAHVPIKLSSGEFLLVAPTRDDLSPINKTVIDYSQNWSQKHLKSIEVGYKKASNFDKYFNELEQILTKQYDSLAALTVKTVLWGISRFVSDRKIKMENLTVDYVNDLLNSKENPFRLRRIFLASETPISPAEKGKANEWIISLCEYAGANEYFYGGTSHTSYMDLEKFKKASITTVLQDWKCEKYYQLYPKLGFISNLGAIDLIMNEDLKSRQAIVK